MAQDSAAGGGLGPGKTGTGQYIEPSVLNALPHYLPLGIFLIIAAAIYGGWWLLPAFLFMSVSGPLDHLLGLDGRNMNPVGTPERRLLLHNLPVWSWALLWPPTLIFGMWQILVANPFAIWEEVILAIILTMEAQAVFVVGHELIHRRSAWERRLGEFLLACASYPQYATEHLYIHHAQVGTPHGRGLRAQGGEFLEVFSARSGEQSQQRLESRRRALGAAASTAVALQQSVLALWPGRGVLVGGWHTGWAASGRFRSSSSSVSAASSR